MANAELHDIKGFILITSDELKLLYEHGDDEDKLLLQKYLFDPFINFTPRPDKPEIFDEQTSFLNNNNYGINACLAGNGAGKSVTAMFKAARFIRTTPPPVDLAKVMIVSQNVSMTGNLYQEHLKQFIPFEMVESVGWYNQAAEHPKNIILKPSGNGNRWMILFRSFEMGRKAMQAINDLCFWVVDELCQDLSLIEEINARTRRFKYPNSKNFVCTPLEPCQWLEERFNNQDQYPAWRWYRMNTECNETLADLSWLDSCSSSMRETRRVGSFMSFDGMVFPEFSYEKHVIKPYDNFPIHTKWYRFMDFGWSHLSTALLVASYDDKIVILKEWGKAGELIDNKVKAIRESMPDRMGILNYGDSEDPQQIAEFGRLGMNVLPIHKDTSLSIELMRRKFMQNKLLIFDNCKELISQIKNYVFPKDNGKGDVKKDRPVRRNDDYLDACRYAVLTIGRNSDLAPWKQPLPQIKQQSWRI